MKEKSNKSNTPRQMRCKYCGHVQPLSQSFCEECGHDMALYGEVIKADSGSGAAPGRLPRWVRPGVALLFAACVIAGVICFVVPGLGDSWGSGKTRMAVEETKMPEAPAATEAPVATKAPEATEPPAATNPQQVTGGITLNCFGLLYDPQDGSQVDWAPQGYTIGYDLSVAYVGEKPGEFDCQVTSSDEGVLQVDGENFRLHAVAPGTATVTASCAGFSDSRNITVYPVNEAAGSSLSFSTPVIEVSGTDPVEVPVTLTMTLGPEAQVVATRYVADKGVTDCRKSGDFVRVDDDVYTMDLIFTIDPKALSDTTDSGILAYMLCKDGDDSYDLERDILAYTVISIVKTG